jgi:hypothetical protein
MPASAEPLARYVTALSLPRHLAQHVATQAAARGLSQAAYIRLLIFRDLQGDATAKG